MKRISRKEFRETTEVLEERECIECKEIVRKGDKHEGTPPGYMYCFNCGSTLPGWRVKKKRNCIE